MTRHLGLVKIRMLGFWVLGFFIFLSAKLTFKTCYRHECVGSCVLCIAAVMLPIQLTQKAQEKAM